MSATRGKTYIGTSGWVYPHWKEVFYPSDLGDDAYLQFYNRHFRAVEINNSFYNLPETTTFANWRKTTSDDFTFAVKASRYITHMKKLKDPKQGWTKLIGRARRLGDKLGPILFQLPPRWHVNVERLAGMLDVLPRTYRYTFEFRDESWFRTEVYETLSQYNAAFCIYELAGTASPKETTADFVYVRLHGPSDAYQGEYTPAVLSGWAGAFSTWRNQGKDIYCFFDNDQNAYAVRNASQLQDMLEE